MPRRPHAVRTGPPRWGAIATTAGAFALYTRVELPWAMLGWVALIPWLASLDRERRTGGAVASGVLMSMAFSVAVFSWFAIAVARYTGIAPLLAGVLLVVAAPALQPQFVVFAWVRHGLAARGAGRPVTIVAAAAAWVATEWLCPRLFGDTIGHGLHPFPFLRQGADLAGAGGLTIVLLLVNEAANAAVAERARAPWRAAGALAGAALLVGALGGYGALRLRQVAAAESSGRPFTAVLVQASLEPYGVMRERLGAFGAVRRILDEHMRLSLSALGRAAASAGSPVDLLVWPETVYPATFGAPVTAAAARFDEEIAELVEGTGVSLLFGTYDRDGDVERNAAVLLQPSAAGPPAGGIYHKRRLFPLTETVPPWLDSSILRRRLPWLGTWQPGDGPAVLSFHRPGGGTLRIAPLICLDAVDPGLALDAARRGADAILTLSNDGWFGTGGGARLHLVVAAFRSIETRLPQLRATNTGITAVVTPTGEVVAPIAVGRSVALPVHVRAGRYGTTLMLRWGDWLGPTALALALLLAGRVVSRRRR